MRLLDLFCGAGGAAMGYHRAGFDEIIGIDIDPQPDYPFEFVRGDATDWITSSVVQIAGPFDLIHASPPCQAHSALTKGTNAGRTYPDLIDQTRAALSLKAQFTPYVIENVAGAPIRKDVMLCGEMFGLGVIRHRYFELGGWAATRPTHKPHRGRVRGWRHGTYYDGPYLAVHGDGGGKGTVDEWQDAMDIEWTDNRKSIAEAIPPAYTQWIGERFLEQHTKEAT